jgi:enoyl-[acyl-carrier protein] reductase I
MASLVRAARPVLAPGSSVVGLTFDGSISWPMYDWMGVAKAALESTSRYLARYLGEFDIRSNLVSAGPIDTLAKKAIPGTAELDHVWDTRATLGWDKTDAEPTAKAVVALLSDWFPKTTGEIIHVDGGVHSTGA